MENTMKTIYYDEKTGFIANRYYYPLATSPSGESHTRQEDGSFIEKDEFLKDGYRSAQITQAQWNMMENKKYWAWKFIENADANTAKKHGVEKGASFLLNVRIEDRPTEEALEILRDWRDEQLNSVMINPDWRAEWTDEQVKEFSEWRKAWKDITEQVKGQKNGNALEEIYENLPIRPKWLKR
jgi:hypothetical protein